MLFGFVTQFDRLSFDEKLAAMAETAAARTERSGLLGIAVMDATIEGQINLIRAAADAGADFVILPPLGPPGCSPDGAAMIEAVAVTTDLAVTIQHAALAGATMTTDQVVALQRRHPNLIGSSAGGGRTVS